MLFYGKDLSSAKNNIIAAAVKLKPARTQMDCPSILSTIIVAKPAATHTTTIFFLFIYEAI